MRKDNEYTAKECEKNQDIQELQWTNDTTLRYSENKSYSDKYLK